VPDFDTTRSGERDEDNSVDVSIWGVLYEDPMFELRLIKMIPASVVDARPDQLTASQELASSLSSLQNQAELTALLTDAKLIGVWQETVQTVAGSNEYRNAIAARLGVTTELRYIIARALVAQALILRAASLEWESEWITGSDRDRLVESLVTALGDRDRSPGAWMAKNLLARPFSRYAQGRRGRLSEKSFAAAGDILFYQARGDGIRDFISKKIDKYDSDVVLVAHSLGGIACVDLLIEKSFPQVEALVTVGSQASFLFEINALVKFPVTDKLPGRLPDHFPKRWLNIYDRRDLLGYKIKGVFEGPAIDDEPVDNGQPFPQAHTSYFQNKQVFTAIRGVL